MQETKDLTLEVIFEEMGEEIASYGTIFSFLQLRVSAEHFVVPLCGFAVERKLQELMPNSFHVAFEKKVRNISKGPIDLIILPLKEDSNVDWNNPYLFEFKMVWQGGFSENISGIKNDLEKLKGYNRGYVIGVLFAFENIVEWSSYKHEYDIKKLSERVKKVVPRSIFDGKSYPVSSSEVRGQVKMLVWKS